LRDKREGAVRCRPVELKSTNHPFARGPDRRSLILFHDLTFLHILVLLAAFAIHVPSTRPSVSLRPEIPARRLSISDTSLCAWPTRQPVGVHDGDMSRRHSEEDKHKLLLTPTLGAILSFISMQTLQFYQGLLSPQTIQSPSPQSQTCVACPRRLG
jgi:hypothetical protein